MRANFDRLFLLEMSFSRGALHVAPSMDIPSPFGVLRGECRSPPGLRFHRVKGRRPVDLVGTTLPPLMLLSRRAFEALSTNGMTGWEAQPVPVDLSGEHESVDYSLLVVRGRSGTIDNSLSRRAVLPPPAGGRTMPGWKGLFFNDSSWDGADVFTPVDSGYVCVTWRVKDLFQAKGFTNMRFDSLAAVERLAL
jgi:hypothetical protein